MDQNTPTGSKPTQALLITKLTPRNNSFHQPYHAEGIKSIADPQSVHNDETPTHIAQNNDFHQNEAPPQHDIDQNITTDSFQHHSLQNTPSQNTITSQTTMYENTDDIWELISFESQTPSRSLQNNDNDTDEQCDGGQHLQYNHDDSDSDIGEHFTVALHNDLLFSSQFYQNPVLKQSSETHNDERNRSDDNRVGLQDNSNLSNISTDFSTPNQDNNVSQYQDIGLDHNIDDLFQDFDTGNETLQHLENHDNNNDVEQHISQQIPLINLLDFSNASIISTPSCDGEGAIIGDHQVDLNDKSSSKNDQSSPILTASDENISHESDVPPYDDQLEQISQFLHDFEQSDMEMQNQISFDHFEEQDPQNSQHKSNINVNRDMTSSQLFDLVNEMMNSSNDLEISTQDDDITFGNNNNDADDDKDDQNEVQTQGNLSDELIEEQREGNDDNVNVSTNINHECDNLTAYPSLPDEISEKPFMLGFDLDDFDTCSVDDNVDDKNEEVSENVSKSIQGDDDKDHGTGVSTCDAGLTSDIPSEPISSSYPALPDEQIAVGNVVYDFLSSMTSSSNVKVTSDEQMQEIEQNDNNNNNNNNPSIISSLTLPEEQFVQEEEPVLSYPTLPDEQVVIRDDNNDDNEQNATNCSDDTQEPNTMSHPDEDENTQNTPPHTRPLSLNASTSDLNEDEYDIIQAPTHDIAFSVKSTTCPSQTSMFIQDLLDEQKDEQIEQQRDDKVQNNDQQGIFAETIHDPGLTEMVKTDDRNDYDTHEGNNNEQETENVTHHEIAEINDDESVSSTDSVPDIDDVAQLLADLEREHAQIEREIQKIGSKNQKNNQNNNIPQIEPKPNLLNSSVSIIELLKSLDDDLDQEVDRQEELTPLCNDNEDKKTFEEIVNLNEENNDPITLHNVDVQFTLSDIASDIHRLNDQQSEARSEVTNEQNEDSIETKTTDDNVNTIIPPIIPQQEQQDDIDILSESLHLTAELDSFLFSPKSIENGNNPRQNTLFEKEEDFDDEMREILDSSDVLSEIHKAISKLTEEHLQLTAMQGLEKRMSSITLTESVQSETGMKGNTQSENDHTTQIDDANNLLIIPAPIINVNPLDDLDSVASAELNNVIDKTITEKTNINSNNSDTHSFTSHSSSTPSLPVSTHSTAFHDISLFLHQSNLAALLQPSTHHYLTIATKTANSLGYKSNSLDISYDLLKDAVQHDDPYELSLFIDGFDCEGMNSMFGNGFSLFQQAIMMNSLEIFDLLSNNIFVDVYAVSRWSNDTVLSLALKGGRYGIVSKLLKDKIPNSLTKPLVITNSRTHQMSNGIGGNILANKVNNIIPQIDNGQNGGYVKHLSLISSSKPSQTETIPHIRNHKQQLLQRGRDWIQFCPYLIDVLGNDILLAATQHDDTIPLSQFQILWQYLQGVNKDLKPVNGCGVDHNGHCEVKCDNQGFSSGASNDGTILTNFVEQSLLPINLQWKNRNFDDFISSLFTHTNDWVKSKTLLNAYNSWLAENNQPVLTPHDDNESPKKPKFYEFIYIKSLKKSSRYG